jgi:type IV pilus assembly protein PilO
MWRIGGVVVAVLVLIVSWFLVVGPTLDKAEALEVETAGQQAASEQLRSRISLLKKQSEELPAQEAKLASIQQRMPTTPALPTLIRNLTTVAEDANVTVASVTPGRPSPVAQPTPPAPPPQPEGEGSEAGDDEAAVAATADAAVGDAAAGGTPAVPAGPEAQAMSLNITACGTFAQLRNYLRELEQMKRVVAVSGLQMSKGSCAEGSAEDDLTANVTAHVFTLPAPVPADSPAGAATKGDDDE